MIDSHGRLHRANLPPRSPAAQAGVERLRRGMRVHKHGRQGRPHETVVSLSQDESVLSWEANRKAQRAASFGRAAGRKLCRNSFASASGEKERTIEVEDIVELLVGQESGVFKRSAGTGLVQQHLCVSLLLPAALPAPPSANDAIEASDATERVTLDLEFLRSHPYHAAQISLAG